MNIAIEEHQHWQHIISSPLTRCYAFAHQLSETTQIPLSVAHDLREISFGDWEGKTAKEIDSAALTLFWSDPILHPAPNGELLTKFRDRVLSTWQSLIYKSVNSSIQNEKVLLIAHGGTIRIILAHVLQIPLKALFNLQIPYAGISRIVVYHHTHDANNYTANNSSTSVASTSIGNDTNYEFTSNVAFINGDLNNNSND